MNEPEKRAAAWIDIVEEKDADGRLAELYERLVDPKYGRVDNVMRVHSLHEEGLDAHAVVYGASMRSTKTLRKVDREMIAVVVSKINECHY